MSYRYYYFSLAENSLGDGPMSSKMKTNFKKSGVVCLPK